GWSAWSKKEDIVFAQAPATELQKILALRIHLDDSTELNGPLTVLPGSHNRGLLNDDEIQELTVKSNPVECVVKRGGILAMRPLLIHSSPKMEGSGSRCVLH